MKTELIDGRVKWFLFKAELQAIVAFASRDPEGMPVLSTVCFDEKTHTVCASDGKRAVCVETREHKGGAGKGRNSLLSVEHFDRLVRLAEKDESVTLVFSVGRVECDVVTDGQLSLFDHAKAFELPLVLDGKFPDLRETIALARTVARGKGKAVENFRMDASLLAPLNAIQRATGDSVVFEVPVGPQEPIVVRSEYAEEETSWTAFFMPMGEKT